MVGSLRRTGLGLAPHRHCRQHIGYIQRSPYSSSTKYSPEIQSASAPEHQCRLRMPKINETTTSYGHTDKQKVPSNPIFYYYVFKRSVFLVPDNNNCYIYIYIYIITRSRRMARIYPHLERIILILFFNKVSCHRRFFGKMKHQQYYPNFW